MSKKQITHEELKKDNTILKKDVAGLKKDVTGLKKDVAGLKKDVHRLDTKIDIKIDALKEEIFTRVEAMFIERTDAILNAIDPLIKTVSDSKTEIAANRGALQRHEARISRNEKSIAQLKEMV